MLEKDTLLVAESGQEYRVLSLISSGTGQGDIYKVSRDDGEYALKLFYAGEEDRMRRQILTLMKRGKACPAYVHPLDILSAEGRLGYVMELIPDDYLPGSVLYNGVENEGRFEELPFHVKLTVLHGLAEALSILYNADLALLDLKFDNLKIHPEDQSVKILDTDTVICSNDDGAMIEGTVGFMPPLTMKGQETPTRYNDSFALAVIIFMTLMGSHPLIGQLGDQPHDGDLETYLFAEDPVYIWHPTDTRNRPTPECYRTECKLMKYPKVFLDAMEDTFVAGLYDRENRTPPDRWCEILEQVYDRSYCCMECGEEQFFDSPACVCDACGLELIKPLLAVGDRSLPLFLETEISSAELWDQATVSEPFATVATTRYKGKLGLKVRKDPIKVIFPDGLTVEFPEGKVAPLFMNATYEYHNKKFTLQEG